MKNYQSIKADAETNCENKIKLSNGMEYNEHLEILDDKDKDKDLIHSSIRISEGLII